LKSKNLKRRERSARARQKKEAEKGGSKADKGAIELDPELESGPELTPAAELTLPHSKQRKIRILLPTMLLQQRRKLLKQQLLTRTKPRKPSRDDWRVTRNEVVGKG
jgi:hypothetical protein